MTADNRTGETWAQPTDGESLPAPATGSRRTTVVGAVRLLVSDLGRSVDFYERVLGLRTVERAGQCARRAPDSGSPILVRLEPRPGLRPAAAGAARSGCTTSPSCCRIARRSDGSSRISRRSAAAPGCPITW